MDLKHRVGREFVWACDVPSLPPVTQYAGRAGPAQDTRDGDACPAGCSERLQWDKGAAYRHQARGPSIRVLAQFVLIHLRPEPFTGPRHLSLFPAASEAAAPSATPPTSNRREPGACQPGHRNEQRLVAGATGCRRAVVDVAADVGGDRGSDADRFHRI